MSDDLPRSTDPLRPLLDAVLAAAPDAIVCTDETGHVTLFNRAAQELFGYTMQQATGLDCAVLLAEGHQAAFRRELGRLLAGKDGSPAALELAGRRRDGSEFPVSLGLSACRVNDRPVLVAFIRDLTARRQATEARANQTRILQAIVDSIGEGVVVADETGKFLIFNPTAARIVGIGLTDTGPADWQATYGIFLPDTVTPYPQEQLPLVRAIHGLETDEAELFIRNANVPDGVFISVTGRPLKGLDGVLRGGVVVFRDITERKRLLEQLQRREQS